MSSNHCIMVVTDRNGKKIIYQEILVPYNRSYDCCEQAYKLRNRWQNKLHEKYPRENYYVFAEWQEMKPKAIRGIGLLEEE